MASHSRRKLLGRVRCRRAVFHCSLPCVRRSYLCGRDPVGGMDYSHRRGWIMIREEHLASLFAIEVEFRSEMSNHLHVVLRTCPRIAKRLSRYEVARRWLTITKLAKCQSDAMPVPDPKKVEELAKDKKRIKKLRGRLTDISWFMGILAENIARPQPKSVAASAPVELGKMEVARGEADPHEFISWVNQARRLRHASQDRQTPTSSSRG